MEEKFFIICFVLTIDKEGLQHLTRVLKTLSWVWKSQEE